jgi:hypothetical protein
MKLHEILNEMAFRSGKTVLSTKLSPRSISDEYIDKHYVIDINPEFAMLLDSESPTYAEIIQWTDTGGIIVGSIRFISVSQSLPVSNPIIVRTIMIAPEMQGKSLGTMAYVTLVKHGYSVLSDSSDSSQSDAAVKLWMRFIKDQAKYKIKVGKIDIGNPQKITWLFKNTSMENAWDDNPKSRFILVSKI